MSDLYTELADNLTTLYTLDASNELVYIAEAGKITCAKETEGNNSNLDREAVANRCDNIKKEADRIVSSRLDILDSEQNYVRRSRGICW